MFGVHSGVPANFPPAGVLPGVIQKAATVMPLSDMEIDDNHQL